MPRPCAPCSSAIRAPWSASTPTAAPRPQPDSLIAFRPLLVPIFFHPRHLPCLRSSFPGLPSSFPCLPSSSPAFRRRPLPSVAIPAAFVVIPAAFVVIPAAFVVILVAFRRPRCLSSSPLPFVVPVAFRRPRCLSSSSPRRRGPSAVRLDSRLRIAGRNKVDQSLFLSFRHFRIGGNPVY